MIFKNNTERIVALAMAGMMLFGLFLGLAISHDTPKPKETFLYTAFSFDTLSDIKAALNDLDAEIFVLQRQRKDLRATHEIWRRRARALIGAAAGDAQRPVRGGAGPVQVLPQPMPGSSFIPITPKGE